jgi:DNA-directed RNA polymerase specialized sigma24 family protein
MMLPFRPKPEKRPGFEEMLFSSYHRLMEWSLQLTGHNREDAEDLIQDLYVQFARAGASGTALDEVENRDAYLFSVLRNLHYAHLRRAGRSPIDDLTIVDFDTIARGLASVDRRKLLYVRSSLKEVCEYTCERKNTSKSASILILRFIFGYFPSEVMQVVRTTRGAVDRLMQIARQEVRLHLERPNVLRSFTPERQRTAFLSVLSDDSQTLFLEMRQAIFQDCVGQCLGREELERRYKEPQGVGFTTAELAHLVSCSKCLDMANTILGLPLLADRSPDDAIGRDDSQGPDGGSTGPVELPYSGPKRRKKAQEAELRNRLERKIREVFEHRPLSLQIAVNGKVRTSQKVTSELSEFHLKLGRTEKLAFVEVLSEQGVRMAYLHVFDPALQQGLEQSEHIALSDDRGLDLTLSFLGDTPSIHIVYRDPVITEEVAEDSAEDRVPAQHTVPTVKTAQEHKPLSRAAHWLRSFCSKLKQSLPEMNPTLATALILATASLGCFVLWLHQPPRVTANAFLVHAETWDVTPSNSAPGVIYQKVRIAMPHRALERALYRDAQGIRVPRRQILSTADTQLKDQLAQAGIDWNTPLSATSYQDWHDRQHVREDSITRAGSHLLKLTTTMPTGEVAQASLTVRDTDFHPVERTVELRDAGTIEIAELKYDVMPWNAVNEDWFEPMAALHPGISGDVRTSVLPLLPLYLSDTELDEAELGAQLALRQAGADTSERIEIVRNPGSIVVRGIVATEVRKHEIETYLNLVPHVVAALYTFREVENSRATGTEITSLKQSSSVTGVSPLEDYLAHQGQNREAIGELGHQLFNSSVEIHQEGKAIASLLQRFAARQALSAKAQASLDALLNDHRQKMLAALQAEKKLLTKIKAVTGPEHGATPSGNLADASATNVALCGELISDNNQQPRSAQAIVPELNQSIAQLRAILDNISLHTPILSSTKPAVSQNE